MSSSVITFGRVVVDVVVDDDVVDVDDE